MAGRRDWPAADLASQASLDKAVAEITGHVNTRFAELNTRLDERHEAVKREIEIRAGANAEAILRLNGRTDGIEKIQRHSRLWDGGAAVIGGILGFLGHKVV